MTTRKRRRNKDFGVHFWIGLAVLAGACALFYQFIVPHHHSQLDGPLPALCQPYCGNAAPPAPAPHGTGTGKVHVPLYALHHLHPHLYQARYLIRPPRPYWFGGWGSLGSGG